MSDTENKSDFVPVSPTGETAGATPTPTPSVPSSSVPQGVPTSGMAIAGLICAFFIPLLGLIFSIIGISQTKDNKKGGRGLAIAGLIISILSMVAAFIWILIFILAAASVDNSINNYSNSNTSSFTNNSTNQVVTGKVGEPVSVDDVQLTVNSVTRNYAPESKYYEPESGKEFIAVNVTVKNNSTQSVNIGTYSFKVRDSAGLELYNSYVGQLTGELETGSLATGGGNTTGLIVFEVAKDDANLVLKFEPAYFGNTAEVTL